jgi:hypothetical protein
MSGQRRRRLDVRSWREILGRFERAGTNISEFCAREGVCESSFYRWRARMGIPGAGVTAAPTMRPRPLAAQPSAASFIDLGSLGGLELRLDLGGGVVLQIVRR